MATALEYQTYPISDRVDDRGRYYGKITAPALTAEQSIRDIMAYKKITAFGEGQILTLLNDLLTGAVELCALDGQTRVLGQLIRVYMALEGSFASPILSTADKTQLRVRTQLLKDMKYKPRAQDFTLTPKDMTYPTITAVHYSGQTENAVDAVKFGAQSIITGRNLLNIEWDPTKTAVSLYNRDIVDSAGVLLPGESLYPTGYSPSENAVVLNPFTYTGSAPTVFTGAGPWNGVLELSDATGDTVYASRNVTVYAA